MWLIHWIILYPRVSKGPRLVLLSPVSQFTGFPVELNCDFQLSYLNLRREVANQVVGNTIQFTRLGISFL
jgi:hypothetical protein